MPGRGTSVSRSQRSKGLKSRAAIIDRALATACARGLDGVTMGALADDLGVSKSGLFGHFRSKQELQCAVLGHAATLFIQKVVTPALKAERGEVRVRALFEHWMKWAESPSGGFFVGVAAEFDDKPGPVRDLLVQTQDLWMDVIRRVVRTGKERDDFRSDVDEDQFAFGIYAVMLAGHHFDRLMKAPNWQVRSRAAFELLLDSARKPRRTRRRSGKGL